MQTGKLLFFEGLRGWCALAVVASHIGSCLWSTNVGAEFPHHAFMAILAVRIFFVLSGFVLSVRGFEASSSWPLLVSAACRRFLRLFWPVYCAQTISYLTLRLGLCEPGAALSQPPPSGFGTFWPQAIYGQKFVWSPSLFLYSSWIKIWWRADRSPPINPVVWTMHCELLGSFLVFFITGVAATVKARGRWLVYIFVLVALFASNPPAPYGFDEDIGGLFSCFVVGVVLADLYTTYYRAANSTQRYSLMPARLRIRRTRAVNTAFSVLREIIALALVSSALTTSYWRIRWLFSLLLPLGIGNASLSFEAAAVVFAVMISRGFRWFFSLRPSLFLGHISFSLYLLHLTVLGAITSRVMLAVLHEHPESSTGWGVSRLPLYLLSLGLTLAITFPLAVLFEIAVDRRAISLAAAVYDRWLKHKEAASAAPAPQQTAPMEESTRPAVPSQQPEGAATAIVVSPFFLPSTTLTPDSTSSDSSRSSDALVVLAHRNPFASSKEAMISTPTAVLSPGPSAITTATSSGNNSSRNSYPWSSDRIFQATCLVFVALHVWIFVLGTAPAPQPPS
jgi:peptidoglycan/LPS O-acetylase OafA/YrhL